MLGRSASDDELRRLAAATQALDAYLPAVQTFVHECWSMAPTEIRAGKAYENEMVKVAFTCAGSYIHMAVDHLLAFRQVLAGGHLPTTACYTLVRGCAEASARGSWLADPSILRSTRVHRGIAERLANAEAHYKVQKDDPTYDKSRYSRLTTHIVQEAMANGIPATQQKNRGGSPRLDIGGRPSMTALVDEQLRRLLGRTEPQTWYYALLSSHAHSAPFTALLSGSPGAIDQHGLMRVDVSANVSQILAAADPAASLLAQATRDFGLMVGRGDAPRLAAPLSTQ